MRAMRLLRIGVVGMLAPLVGCAVGADLLNPGVFTALGLDPSTIIPSQGSIVVVYNNQTQFPAQFHVLGLNSTETDGIEQTGVVAASGVGNSVFDCPVEVILPGRFGAAAQGGTAGISAAAVDVGTATVTAVNYAGAALRSGEDYQCGDVVEIRLDQVATGTGQQAQVGFLVSVFVRRGR